MFQGSGVRVGLIFILAVFGTIAMLFTGKYPAGFSKLVIGTNRWSHRVAAYMLCFTVSGRVLGGNTPRIDRKTERRPAEPVPVSIRFPPAGIRPRRV